MSGTIPLGESRQRNHARHRMNWENGMNRTPIGFVFAAFALLAFACARGGAPVGAPPEAFATRDQRFRL